MAASASLDPAVNGRSDEGTAEPSACVGRRGAMTLFIKRLFLVPLALAVAACSSAASSPPSNPSPSTISITTPEAAAGRVAEVMPGLQGIGPRDPDLIGGCCFWEGAATADGFDVTFEVGWGDCPSGCIDKHHWTYGVSREGGVTLLREDGPPVPSGVPGGGGGSTGGGGILPGGTGIQGRVLAGPTCPVVKANDPSCDDRPVAGAALVILNANGAEVARIVTDAQGRYAVTLPMGPYTIEPQPVEGFFRGSEPVAVEVGQGVSTVDIAFDTGIR